MSSDTLHHLTTDHLDAAWSHLDELTDRELVVGVMGVLARPRAVEADSFMLHAPLELLARAELLPDVERSVRPLVRRRIAEIAARWNEIEPESDGESPDADASIFDAVGAAEHLLGRLGGAGHLAIFLDLLGRAPRAPRAATVMGRTLLRDVAAHPDWTLRWIDEPMITGGPSDLASVLVAPPSAGDPGSNFIYPTMHLVDASGLAAELLAGPVVATDPAEAGRQLLRVAAMSMLQDDPANAPYGWTHCLTMPQAVLAIAPQMADPRRAVAIAATYVLGFRATQSAGGIDLAWRPTRPAVGADPLQSDAEAAVALAWHAEAPDAVSRAIASYAAAHHDAHLAKYALACLRAAADDPEHAPLYRAAAVRLAVWWRDRDAVGASSTAGGGSDGD